MMPSWICLWQSALDPILRLCFVLFRDFSIFVKTMVCCREGALRFAQHLAALDPSVALGQSAPVGRPFLPSAMNRWG